MKALLIGNGAREHVIAEKIAENAELYAFMSRRNPGIIKICKDFKIGNLLDFEKIKEFSESTRARVSNGRRLKES